MNKSISFFLFFLQLFFISSAYSETVARVYRYSPPGGGTFATLQNACDGFVAYKNLDEAGAFLISIDQQPYPSQSSCLVQNQPRFNSQSRVYVSVDMGCPPNTQLNGENMCDSSCVAPSVYDSATSTCKSPNLCQGKTLSSTSGRAIPSVGDGGLPASACIFGCQYSINKKNVTLCSGAVCIVSVISTSTGQTCTDSVTPTSGESEIQAPKTPQEECVAKGMSYGTINGTVVCAVGGTNGVPPVNVSTETKDSFTTPAGVTTSTTNTTNTINNNSVSTTTTTTYPDGTTKTETKEQPIDNFCELNPNSQICKEAEKSTFSGSCTVAFQCTGDAIQCAISKEQHKRHCELFEKETSMTTEGKKLIDGTATDNNPAKIENRENVNLAGMINEGSNIGGGSFTDKIISLRGGGVTLPFAKLNFMMQILGGFILAAAYINAARIVGVR